MNPNKPFTISAEELEHMRDQTFVWKIDLSPGSLKDDDMEVLDIEGTLTLRRQLDVVKCQGDLWVRVRLTSGRSLEPYETEMPIHFEEGLEIVQYVQLPEKLELGMDDAVDQIRPDQPIDLTELLRQHIILNLPFENPDARILPEAEAFNEAESCYNEASSEAPGDQNLDSPWGAIRKTVESWEHPSDN
jgi:uncharacterized metal-binding protein YceD (DUF177 family)